MNSKKKCLNITDYSINNKNENKEKHKFKWRLNSDNNFIYNSNNSKEHILENKKIILNPKQKKLFCKETEDFYNFEIYKDSIAKNNFCCQTKEDLYKYQTFTIANSFKNKYKKVFNFNKYRSYKKINEISPMKLSSELNLSFEIKYNKNFLLEKSFNCFKANLHLTNIIRIFDKNHKQMEKVNQKIIKNKNNHYFIYKNRINNYNYLKFKTKSKFSKKDKNKTLKNEHDKETHMKLNSEPLNNKKISLINIDKRRYINKVIEKEHKHNIDLKIDNELDLINDINSYNKNFSNNKNTEKRNIIDDNQLKKCYIPTEINKNFILCGAERSSGSKEINNSNRNSANFNGKFFYKYKNINNMKINSEILSEESEKNNNYQFVNESPQLKDTIKNRQIIKKENIENKGIIYKKVQSKEIYKNQNKIYSNPKEIKIELDHNSDKKNKFKHQISLTTSISEKDSTINDKKISIPLNINKRKKNMYLSNEKNEYTNNNFEKTSKKENNSISMNLGSSFILSNNNISRSLIKEKKNNEDLRNPVINLINKENSKNSINDNKTKLNDKNIINNNKKFIFKSDKANKSKIIFKNYDYKEIKAKNYNIKQKNEMQKEKMEDLKSERFKKRTELNKTYEEEKNYNNNIKKEENIRNIKGIKINCENPFRDNNNYYNSKNLNNRYNNHKFHEIKSTSCDKNNKKMLNYKNNNQKLNYNISNNIEKKVEDKNIASSSMRYINLRRKMNYLNKAKNIDIKDENEKQI